MNRRKLVGTAAAGAVALAAPRVSEAKEIEMVSEQRTFVVRGIYQAPKYLNAPTPAAALDPGYEPEVEQRVAVRFTGPDSTSSYGPSGQEDDMTILVDEASAHLWTYGKRITVTIEGE